MKTKIEKLQAIDCLIEAEMRIEQLDAEVSEMREEPGFEPLDIYSDARSAIWDRDKKIESLEAEVERLRTCEPIDCLIEAEARVEQLEAEVDELRNAIKQWGSPSGSHRSCVCDRCIKISDIAARLSIWG